MDIVEVMRNVPLSQGGKSYNELHGLNRKGKKAKQLYARRNPIEQGQFYVRHAMAMTAEDLYSKADIAKELAHRDIKIDKLIKLATKAILLLGKGTNEEPHVVELKCQLLDIRAE